MSRWIATREESEQYNFLFQRPVYVHNQLCKCRLLITFENSSDPTKRSCDNACICSLVSAGLIIIVVLN